MATSRRAKLAGNRAADADAQACGLLDAAVGERLREAAEWIKAAQADHVDGSPYEYATHNTQVALDQAEEIRVLLTEQATQSITD